MVKIIDKDRLRHFLRTFADASNRALKNELFDLAVELRNNSIREMRRTTKDSSKRYKKGGKFHHPSLPGFPPAIDSGNLISKIFPSKTTNGAEVHVDSPYAGYLEEGTKNMEKRPVWEDQLIKLAAERDLTSVIRGLIK